MSESASSPSLFSSLKSPQVVVPAIYLGVAILNAIVPGPIVKGYAKDWKGKPLVYRLNGFRVLLLSLFLSYVVVSLNILPASYFHDNLWESFYTANTLGIVASLGFYMIGKGPQHVCAPKIETYNQKNRNENSESPARRFFDFFFGFELNPRYGLFDFKMYLYLIGAIMLELLILSAASVEVEQYGSVSSPTLLYVFLLSWFVFEYVYHEHVHLVCID